MKKTLALILTFIMVLALVPSVALAADPVAWIGEKGYATLGEAVKDAESGDTITLGEGDYSLYDVCGHTGALGSSKDYTAGKDLTFIGKGEKTIWQIGSKTPDPEKEKGEFNGDYSFDGAGTVTFKKMTLRAPLKDSGKGWNYLGFIRADNTIVENCTMFGKTFYWGYKSAKFTNTTFNCPDDDYALWTYSSPTMTFDNCTFNSSGKVINVYNEGGTKNVEVNFNNCTVNSENTDSLSVMNINDALVDSFTINFNGKNTIKGIKADGIQKTDGSHASAAQGSENGRKTSEQATCSKLFEFNMKYGNGNNKRTTVNIDGKTVWQDGKKVRHAIDTTNDKYTDGYKDNAFEIIKDDTTGVYVKTCKYCGYTEPFYGELSNEIGLKRTVRQNKNSNPVPADDADPNKYKVANSSGITVDYTATMDMTKLKWEKQGSLYDDEITPWQMLAMQPGWITEDTVVFLKFTFDKNIDLGTFQTNYNNATTSEAKEKLLKLESNMFKIADEGGVQFDIEKREMTIKCNWNWNKETGHAPEPKITLNGYGLPVTNDWNGSKQINIENSGCVSGTVHIKYINPRPDAKKIAETVHNVAANVQVQNTYPPVDNTIKIPIVGGCKTDEFTLYYGGGSSGDNGGGYYHPTTTPVPVIVIPPKTGDMTIWQSILHFLGIR